MSNLKTFTILILFIVLSINNLFSQNSIIDQLNSKLNSLQLDKISECDLLMKKSDSELKNAIEIEAKPIDSNEAKLLRISSVEYTLEASLKVNQIYIAVITDSPISDSDVQSKISKNIEEAKTELDEASENFILVKKNIKRELKNTNTNSIISYLNSVQRMQNLAIEKQNYAMDLYIQYSNNQALGTAMETIE